MDIDDARHSAQILQCKESVANKYYNNSNELDLTPESDSSYCCCEVDEVPKIFPKRSRTPRAVHTESSTISSDPPKTVTCPGFFQKVMENARSILSMKCSNIHPSDIINEEPTKDVGSCICDSDDKPWQSTNLTSKEMEYASLSSYECICDDESTRYDSTPDSYSCSVSCSCQISDYQKDIEGGTKSENNTYIIKSSTKSDYKSSKSVNSGTCTCSNSQINTATYSIKNSEKSCECCATKASISDKMVQQDVENKDISCDCCSKVHSTGTKMYQMDNLLGPTSQKTSKLSPTEKVTMVCNNIAKTTLSDKNTGTISQPTKSVTAETSERNSNKKKLDSLTENVVVIECKNSKKSTLSDKNVGAIPPSMKNVTVEVRDRNVEEKKLELKNCWVNTKKTELKNVNVGIKKTFCNDPACPSYALTKSYTTPNISQGVQGQKSVSSVGTCHSGKKLRSKSGSRDQNDQCAFVGSPILKAANFTGEYHYPLIDLS